MITSHKWSGKPSTVCVIQDDFAEVEELLEAEWMVEEDNFRKFLSDLEKAYVWNHRHNLTNQLEMKSFQRFFDVDRDIHEAKLREMWARVIQDDENRKQDEEIEDQGLDDTF